MKNRAALSVGRHVVFQGEEHVVVGFVDGAVQIENVHTRSKALVSVAALFGDPSFELLGEDLMDGEEEPTYIDTLPEDVLQEALAKRAHVREVLVGYKSGSADDALPGEPRPRYDPERTPNLTDRVLAKAAELGCDERSVWRYIEKYFGDDDDEEREGLAGLIDRRGLRAKVRTKYQAWVEHARAVLGEPGSRKRSDLTISGWLAEINRQLPKGVKRPKRSHQYALVRPELVRFGFMTQAKYRRTEPEQKTYSIRELTRPGQVVMVDATPVDVLGIDPGSGEWVPAEWVGGIDVATRTMLDGRAAPLKAKAVDMAHLLFGMLTPKPGGPLLGEHGLWRVEGAADVIIRELFPQFAEGPIAAMPFIFPETIVVDNGKVMISEVFMDVCHRARINVHFARLGTPEDKAVKERFFDTLRTGILQHLPGYKGSSVHERGEDPQADAALYLPEIEDIVLTWTAEVYHHRPHHGITLPRSPRVTFTPFEAYAECLARTGFLYYPANKTLYFECLQSKWRKISRKGVTIDNLTYDHPVLAQYHDQDSPYRGRYPGFWPFKSDPHDLSRVYFYDLSSKTWVTIPWVHAFDVGIPFPEATVRYAKRLLEKQKNRAAREDELYDVFLDLLNRAVELPNLPRAEQLALRDWSVTAHRVLSDRKRAAWAVGAPLDPDLPDLQLDASAPPKDAELVPDEEEVSEEDFDYTKALPGVGEG